MLGQTHANGNFLEPEGISVRHGICGDPVQVKHSTVQKYSTYIIYAYQVTYIQYIHRCGKA